MLVTDPTNPSGQGGPDSAPARTRDREPAQAATWRYGAYWQRWRRRRANAGETLRTRAQEAGGFTLVELLVAMVAAVTVLGAAFAMLESSQRVQARDSEWALTLQEDRAGLARMMRDMRQATEVKESKPGAVFFLELIEGKEWEVKYQCTVTQSGTTYTECVRLAAEKGKGLPATGPRIAKDVLNGTQVFSYSPSSESSKVRAATARIELPASGTLKQAGSSGYTHKVVLEDAAFMRTVYPEG